jgi:hypothetical protein
VFTRTLPLTAWPSERRSPQPAIATPRGKPTAHVAVDRDAMKTASDRFANTVTAPGELADLHCSDVRDDQPCFGLRAEAAPEKTRINGSP